MNILITGGTDGIGLALTKKLLNLNHNVFIIGRNLEKGNKIVNTISNNKLNFFQCDLTEKTEITRLIKEIDKLKCLDVLINNAGAIFDKRAETSDGIEKTFALNHLSYFHLSVGLKNLLESSKVARIINISSNAHKRYSLDLMDLENKKNYSGWKAYCQSKLLNVLMTYSFKKKFKTKINCNCLHPGFVNSNFGNNNKSIYRSGIEILKNIFAISNETAALTPLYLALSEDLVGVSDKYFYKLKEQKSSMESYNKDMANIVWEKSLDYIK